MRVYNRIFALLAFSVLFVSAASAQLVTSQLPANQTLAASQEISLNPAHVPHIEIYAPPGTGRIRISVENYRPSTPVSVHVLNSNNRIVRQQIGAICTICGTFDIDIDEELSQGLYRVVVVTDAQMVTRQLYIK